jgi:hypothetical protein
MDPSLDGQTVFGTACHVVHEPHPVVVQKDSFFGISGVTALYGGSRGRRFHISGVLVGPDLATVLITEGLLLSMADGIARTFVDTQGRAWPNVIFEGMYRPFAEGPKETDFGWCLPYSCTLEGLS